MKDTMDLGLKLTINLFAAREGVRVRRLLGLGREQQDWAKDRLREAQEAYDAYAERWET